MNHVSLKKASFITAISKYSTVFLGLIFSAVLARLLTPEDYGIVAVTFVFTSFFSLFADMGIGSAIVQNKELTDRDLENIFTFSLRLSFSLFLLFSLFSIPLSAFYGNKEYVPIGILLAISLFFSSLNMVPNAILLREKRFLLIGIRTVVISICTGIVGIIFAFSGFKYYALVIQSIGAALITFLWNYFTAKVKFSKNYDKSSIRKIKNYSGFLFLFNIINYFSRNTDNLVISKIMGNASLGYYDKAYKLMLYPVGNLTDVVTPVLHPILADYQNDKKKLYEKYLLVVKIMSFLGAFVMPYCYYSGAEIITILFGNNWKLAIPCFQWMSISIWAQMITGLSGSIFQSINDTKNLFVTGTINSIIVVIAIILGCIEKNINAVARNVGIAYNIVFLFTHIMLVCLSFKMNIFGFIKALLPDLFSIFIIWGAGFLIDELFLRFSIDNNVLRCLERFMFMGIIYIVCVLINQRYKIIRSVFSRQKNGA